MLFPFLSAFNFAGMLLVGGRELCQPVVSVDFLGCIFIHQKLGLVSFMGVTYKSVGSG